MYRQAAASTSDVNSHHCMLYKRKDLIACQVERRHSRVSPDDMLHDAAVDVSIGLDFCSNF